MTTPKIELYKHLRIDLTKTTVSHEFTCSKCEGHGDNARTCSNARDIFHVRAIFLFLTSLAAYVVYYVVIFFLK